MQDRLQKILARAGVASRRTAEQMIVAGRVRVNGRVVAELGTQADARLDRIEVDGKRVVAENFVYILFHKPRAVMSTMEDPEKRPTVADYFESLPLRLYPVGRLDYQTSGALLVTNDGDFTARMLHPRFHVPKHYLIKVQGEMTAEDAEKWRDGVMLEDGVTLPAELVMTKREAGYTWFELMMREGRNQQIRRMGEATGFPVIRLTRLAFAGVSIDGLRAGQWRLLSLRELRDLRDLYGVPQRLRSVVSSHEKIAKFQSEMGRVAARDAKLAPVKNRVRHDNEDGYEYDEKRVIKSKERGRKSDKPIVRRSEQGAARKYREDRHEPFAEQRNAKGSRNKDDRRKNGMQRREQWRRDSGPSVRHDEGRDGIRDTKPYEKRNGYRAERVEASAEGRVATSGKHAGKRDTKPYEKRNGYRAERMEGRRVKDSSKSRIIHGKTDGFRDKQDHRGVVSHGDERRRAQRNGKSKGTRGDHRVKRRLGGHRGAR